jgi:hypothetical protein
MLTKNKLGRYVIYALGEIVLVVIGILIALQVNDWNDHQKQLKLEQEYYCRLQDDAKLDEEQIMDLLNLAKDRLTAANESVRLLLDDEAEKLEIAIQVGLSTTAIYSDFAPNNSAYLDLTSGANLNILSDKSIIKDLNRYFNKVEELKSIIMINGQHAVDISFAHSDYFANGSVQASIATGRFKEGMDRDLKEVFQSLDPEPLTKEMRNRLLNESLEFIGANTRQIELYGLMLQEIQYLQGSLGKKCHEGDS